MKYKNACIVYRAAWSLLRICSAIMLAGMASCCAVGLGGSDAFGAGSKISVLCERDFGKVYALSKTKFA
ncbi:hypothetical protein D3C81_404050 [compost metagenome]